MATFLLEIGTEEIPADFARLVIPQLQEMVSQDLKRVRLNTGPVFVSTTPRRIIISIEDLALKAKDSSQTFKGPPFEQAYSNGEPTKAAIGFAKRFNLKPDQLEKRETDKGIFVFATQLEKGFLARDLLAQLIPEWISNIQGNRFMRWGVGDRTFTRPIRWIVSLFDSEVLPLKLIDCDPVIIASNVSRGHRLISSKITITSLLDYSDKLNSAGVITNRDQRLSKIKTLVHQRAEELEAHAELSEALLNELTDLVESPSIVCGQFDDSFLELPPEVLSMVMLVHQRYVPLYFKSAILDPLVLNSRNVLLPNFIVVSNALPTASETVKEGNEKVIKARFSDAQFFIKADLSVSSESRVKRLSDVTFAKGLGTLLDRVNRVSFIAQNISSNLNFESSSHINLLRSAKLCKHDLVSDMVFEFPELQGIIGSKYLLIVGENRAVATAVLEHYKPRNAEDSLPESEEGAALAIADRMELLISIFSIGKRPSGSSDPYALRRAGNGIIQIIWSRGWQLNLSQIIDSSLSKWVDVGILEEKNRNDLSVEISHFFRQRIQSLLEDSGIALDLVQAVSGVNVRSERILSDPLDVRLRAKLLSHMRETNQLLAIRSVVIRAAKLASKSSLDFTITSPLGVVDPKLFEKSSEEDMLATLKSLEPITRTNSSDRYQLLAKGLAEGSATLASFFDGEQSVMVMTDNLAVRQNRLNLLAILSNQASVLADFTQILS